MLIDWMFAWEVSSQCQECITVTNDSGQLRKAQIEYMAEEAERCKTKVRVGGRRKWSANTECIMNTLSTSTISNGWGNTLFHN